MNLFTSYVFPMTRMDSNTEGEVLFNLVTYSTMSLHDVDLNSSLNSNSCSVLSLPFYNRNYSFLNDIQKEFNIKYTPKKIVKLNAYGLEKQFKTKINSIMHHYNTTGRTTLNNDTQASNLNAEVESIKKIMGNSIDIMMRSEANIENLVVTTDDLLEDSKVFTRRGRKLKKVMKKKAWCYKVILIGFAFLTIYLMAVTFCGFDLTCAEEHYY